MSLSRRVLLIVNPAAAAGRMARCWERLLAELSSRRIKADRQVTVRPGHAVALAQAATRSYDVVVAVGGDGTVNEVASGILLAGETTAVLGVVPLGTGNDLAHLLGIRSMEDAINALVSGTGRAMDAIEVRCQEAGITATRYAVLYAAVGFPGELLKRTTPAVKRLFGPRYCYSVGFFRALLHFKSPMMRLRCDGREYSGKMFFVSAGNAEIVGAGTMRLSPGAKVDDGKLNVNIFQAVGPLEAAWRFSQVLRGTHTTHPKVRYFEASVVTVECEPEAEVQMDGEQFGRTPAAFQVRPRAIRVMTTCGGSAG